MTLPVGNPALLPPGVAGAPAPSPAPAPGKSGAPGKNGAPGNAAPANAPSFADLLAQSAGTTGIPRFSRHALDRLQQRGIDLGSHTLERLAGGVARAAGKGSRDSVVFVDGTAFVVSVKNNTVITAVGPQQMRDQVFTNIDSAVIA